MTDSIIAQLAELDAQERLIDAQLNQLLQSRSKIEQTWISTHKTFNFNAPQQKTIETKKQIEYVSSVAFSLEKSVKLLDDAQKRLRETLESVDELLDVKLATEQVQEALDRHALDSACKSCHRVLGPFRKRTSSNNRIDKTRINAFTELMNLEKRVIEQLEHEVTIVMPKIASGDMSFEDQALKLAILYPLLDMRTKGLEMYCYILSIRVTRTLKRIDTSVDAIRCVPQVIDALSLVIRDYGQSIQSTFGPGAHILLLKELQVLANEFLGPIVKTFISKRELGNVTSKIVKRTQTEQTEDPRKLDALLDEIAFVCREVQMFDGELVLASKDAIDMIKNGNEQLLDAGDAFKNPLSPGKTTAIIQEMHSPYISLESHVLDQNMKKAVKLNEMKETSISNASVTSPVISPVVEDVFFLVKKSLTRAFSVMDIGTTCAVINMISSVFERDYVSVLQGRIGLADNDMNKVILLNTIEQSCIYMTVLTDSLKLEAEDTFRHHPKVVLITHAINELVGLGKKLSNMVDQLNGSFTKIILTKLQPSIQSFQSTSTQAKQESNNIVSSV